jgi:hypothetical protein
MIILGLFTTHPAFAEGLSDQHDRIVIDWGNLTVRYFGQAEPASQNEDFNALALRARQDSHDYLMQNLPEINRFANLEMDPSLATDAAYIAKRQKSLNTTYFSSGRVQIDMEIPLTSVLKPKAVRFSELNQHVKPSEVAKTAGLILELDQHQKPSATYTLVDEAGEVLVSPEDVTADNFSKNLMGRWYRSPSKTDLIASVGSHPIRFKAKVLSPDRYQIERESWQEVQERALKAFSLAKIAIIVP